MNNVRFKVTNYFWWMPHLGSSFPPGLMSPFSHFNTYFMSDAMDFLPLVVPMWKWKAFSLGARSAQLVFYLPPVQNDRTHLHLPGQIFVLVTDDRQSGLLTQSVGAVSERLLQSRRRRRTAYFFITKAQTPLVWSWGKWKAWLKVLMTQQSLCLADMTLFCRWLRHEAFRNTILIHSVWQATCWILSIVLSCLVSLPLIFSITLPWAVIILSKF